MLLIMIVYMPKTGCQRFERARTPLRPPIIPGVSSTNTGIFDMNAGKLVFSQLMDFIPWHTMRRCIDRYHGDYKVQSFRCTQQYRCMAFAQLTYREILRDIETCLRAQSGKLNHMGIQHGVSRSTLAKANQNRDWRIYSDFTQRLIDSARQLYQGHEWNLDLDATVYALDSSTIDLCLSLFPWAPFRQTKAAVKLHTLLDLQGNIPAFIHISDGKLHDVNILDQLIPESGAFYIMDRGYLDFTRLQVLNMVGSHFVLRAKKNTRYQRVYSQPVDRSTGVICDQRVRLTGTKTKDRYPELLRRIRYRDPQRDMNLVFLTNNMELAPLTIAELYKSRWQVELFFKWTKQRLRIKSFYGNSENAVKSQLWIAISVYVLCAIIRKKAQPELGLYTIMQVFSLTLFERISLNQ